MLKVLQSFKESKKKKQRMKREVYGETQRSGKHRKECICDFCCIFKTSEKERKIMALTTNDSTKILTS